MAYGDRRSTGFTGLGSVIAVGLAGGVHIAYLNDDDVLGYAVKGVFNEWYVESVPDSGRPCGQMSIDLDWNGYGHVGYMTGYSNTLTYAYEDMAGWHVEVLPRGRGAAT